MGGCGVGNQSACTPFPNPFRTLKFQVIFYAIINSKGVEPGVPLATSRTAPWKSAALQNLGALHPSPTCCSCCCRCGCRWRCGGRGAGATEELWSVLMAKMYPIGVRFNTRTILNFMTTTLTWNRCELFKFQHDFDKNNNNKSCNNNNNVKNNKRSSPVEQTTKFRSHLHSKTTQLKLTKGIYLPVKFADFCQIFGSQLLDNYPENQCHCTRIRWCASPKRWQW